MGLVNGFHDSPLVNTEINSLTGKATKMLEQGSDKVRVRSGNGKTAHKQKYQQVIDFNSQPGPKQWSTGEGTDTQC